MNASERREKRRNNRAPGRQQGAGRRIILCLRENLQDANQIQMKKIPPQKLITDLLNVRTKKSVEEMMR